MLGKCVTQQGREIVLRVMGRASYGSGDVAIVAFVMPLDALARLGFEFQGRDGRTTSTTLPARRWLRSRVRFKLVDGEVFAPEAKNR